MDKPQVFVWGSVSCEPWSQKLPVPWKLVWEVVRAHECGRWSLGAKGKSNCIGYMFRVHSAGVEPRAFHTRQTLYH